MENRKQEQLKELTRERQKHLDSCRRNGDRSHERIANLYSDSFHFIYELLQNADDAKASEVKFCFTSESLSIAYDGKPFDIGDVESITTVGSSTKKDVNSIGKFGAGFKSVFAITETPCIHSGGFHFKITDYIVPEEIAPIDIEERCTKIILPRNRVIRSGNDNGEQNFLKLLVSDSLLFLRCIKSIQWETENDSGCYSKQIKGNKARLISRINGEEEILREYFLSTKDIKIDETELNIAVAYLLGSDGEIVPVNTAASLFVFFPTKESTGFQFLVHAPYKTTPNRELIPFEDEQNKRITATLSELIAGSIKELKDGGLLNTAALSILPINSDNEHQHPLYTAAFERVKRKLDSGEPLLPTSKGGYECCQNAILAREKKLTELLDETDCVKLFDKRFWLDTDITTDKMPTLVDYLTKELEIRYIVMEDFFSVINDDFMRSKSDDWVGKFYSKVRENQTLVKKILWVRPIIRLEDDSHICSRDDSGKVQVYLPSPEGQSGYKTVKRDLLRSDEVKEFLEENIGLKEPDNIAEIEEFIIPKYHGRHIEEGTYIKDFERIYTVWVKSDEYKKREIKDLLRKSHFIRCLNQNGVSEYQKPDEVYFPESKLKEWFGDNTDDEVYFLDLPVELEMTEEEQEKFVRILGVRNELKMLNTDKIDESRHGYHRLSVNGFNPQFDIHGLRFALENITFERSVCLWSLILKNANRLKGHIESTTNLSNPFVKGEELTSTAMHRLSGFHWLYDKQQRLFDSPIGEILPDELNDEYQTEDDNLDRLVKTLGLRSDEIKNIKEQLEKYYPTMRMVPTTEIEAQTVRIQELESKNSQLQTIIDGGSGNNSPQNDIERDVWEPDVEPDEVTEIIEINEPVNEPKSRDLSNQSTKQKMNQEGGNSEQGGEEATHSPVSPRDRKNIGKWGEKVVKRFLEEQYKHSSYEVVWCNENENIVKGYDFVIKDANDQEIAYYEVKSTTRKSPRSFEVSRIQWNWAKDLHASEEGDKYTMLLVSNAGKSSVGLRAIRNPVELWHLGALDANPVQIKL